jgi:hypothetical protein
MYMCSDFCKRSGAIVSCFVLAAALIAGAGVLGGCKKQGGRAESKTAEAKPAGLVVVASTSWTAAIAMAGGAEDVRILAPVDLRHPPEYELKPSDLTAVSEADLIVYAGWEMFAEKLKETAAGSKAKVLALKTTNSPETLKKEAAKVAEALGTAQKFEAWSAAFDVLTGELQRQVGEAYPDKRAVVQRMQTPFASWLGFEIAGEYGPAEPSPAVIVEMVNLKPALVIDNYHGPSGQPIAEASGAVYAELINFPGRDNTKTLDDVFRYNARVLIDAAGK